MSFCPNCGTAIREGVSFCYNCGSRLGPAASQPAEQRISENITLGADGKYRWTYALNLYTHPSVFYTVWLIFFFIFLGIMLMINIVDAVEWSDWFPDRLINNLIFCGWFLLGMTVVVGLSYLIYAATMGGKYIVEFEMDERGVNHRQIEEQAKKARAIGAVSAVIGAANGRPGAVGAGVAAQRTAMYSDFASVRRVKANPRTNTIKVNAFLDHNQVYASDEDFAFVRDYIVSHCPNLK